MCYTHDHAPENTQTRYAWSSSEQGWRCLECPDTLLTEVRALVGHERVAHPRPVRITPEGASILL